MDLNSQIHQSEAEDHSTSEVTPVSMVMIGGIVGTVVLHHAVDV